MQVYLKGGLPQFSRSAFLATLQGWLQRVGGTTDFQYLMLSAVFLPQQSLSLVGPQSTQSKQCIRHDVDSMLHEGLQCWQPGTTLMMDWLVQVLHVPMTLHSVQGITHCMVICRSLTWQSQTCIEHNSPC